MDNNKHLIGYQVESADGNNDLPPCVFSFEIFNKSQARELLDDQSEPDRWNIVPIYDGDIENPTISFENDPND